MLVFAFFAAPTMSEENKGIWKENWRRSFTFLYTVEPPLTATSLQRPLFSAPVSLRGRRSKGKGKGIRARDLSPLRAPHALARPNSPFPFPF